RHPKRVARFFEDRAPDEDDDADDDEGEEQHEDAAHHRSAAVDVGVVRILSESLKHDLPFRLMGRSYHPRAALACKGLELMRANARGRADFDDAAALWAGESIASF